MVARATKSSAKGAKVLSSELIFQGRVFALKREQVVEPSGLTVTREIIVQFSKATDAIFEQVNTLQRQIQNLRRTRDLLLPRLLSGQINLKMN